jgi:hypothetical protein
MSDINVALCFWGLTRSLQFTLPSIRKYIFAPLNKNNIKYTIFLHTYHLNRPYTNIHGGEKNIDLDNNEYKLLKPDQYIIENQDVTMKRLNPDQFLTHGGWVKEKEPVQTSHNFVLSLWSLKQVTSLWEGKSFTHVMYCRPDVTYMSPLDIKWFTKTDIMYLPKYFKAGYNGEFICDRFALGTPTIMSIYGNRYDELLSYSKKHQLHSETFLGYTLKKHRIRHKDVHFIFVRTRADGCMTPLELNELINKKIYTRKNARRHLDRYANKSRKLFGKYNCGNVHTNFLKATIFHKTPNSLL